MYDLPDEPSERIQAYLDSHNMTWEEFKYLISHPLFEVYNCRCAFVPVEDTRQQEASRLQQLDEKYDKILQAIVKK